MKAKPPFADSRLETYTPRLIALSLLAVLLLFAFTGCKHESRATASLNPAGVYTLVSVDDQAVPCKVKHEGTALSIKSGVFTITADGSCRSQITFSAPERGDMSREVKATYTQKDTELTMQWEGAGLTKGQINGNQFTMTNEGMIFSYRK
jgi:hypothetical protein